MDHLPKLGRRARWQRAGRRAGALALVRAAVGFVLAAFLLGLSVGAFAYGTVPSTTEPQVRWRVQDLPTSDPRSGDIWPSANAACDAMFDVAHAIYACSPDLTVAGASCSCGRADGQGASYGVESRNVNVAACPADATLEGGACVCNSGFKPNAGSCAAINCSEVGDAIDGQRLSWSGNTRSFCYQGCNMNAGVWGYSGTTGKSYTDGELVNPDGSSCQGAAGSGNDAGVELNQTLPCPVGQCPGTVNGQPVCVPCTSTSQQATQTTTTPSGAASAPTGVVPGTTTTERTNTGGQVTTTTTTRDANGNVVSQTTETEPEGSFCAENPEVLFCKQSSFQGACGGFQCDGDAVQCALAKELHKRNCEFFEGSSAQSQAGTDAVAGGDRPGDHPGNSAEETPFQFSSRIDQTDRIGSGGGLVDQVVSIGGGRTVTLPFSQLASPLSLLGNLLVGVCMFWSAFIVFRSK